MSTPDDTLAAKIDGDPYRWMYECLQRFYDAGCPSCICKDGSRTRDGCALCQYCEANLDRDESHATDCLWLEIATFLGHS